MQTFSFEDSCNQIASCLTKQTAVFIHGFGTLSKHRKPAMANHRNQMEPPSWVIQWDEQQLEANNLLLLPRFVEHVNACLAQDGAILISGFGTLLLQEDGSKTWFSEQKTFLDTDFFGLSPVYLRHAYWQYQNQKTQTTFLSHRHKKQKFTWIAAAVCFGILAMFFLGKFIFNQPITGQQEATMLLTSDEISINEQALSMPNSKDPIQINNQAVDTILPKADSDITVYNDLSKPSLPIFEDAIVVGAFKYEQNAIKLQQKFQKQGHKVILIPTSESNKLTRVLIIAPNKTETASLLSQIRNQHIPDAWLLE